MTDGVKTAFSLIYRVGVFVMLLSLAIRAAKILTILEGMRR